MTMHTWDCGAKLSKIWTYDAFDAADDWWVQWGMLRERALSLQNPSIEIPGRRLEVSICAQTNLAHELLCS